MSGSIIGVTETGREYFTEDEYGNSLVYKQDIWPVKRSDFHIYTSHENSWMYAESLTQTYAFFASKADAEYFSEMKGELIEF